MKVIHRGSTLMQHASNSNVQSLLYATEWDYVILQEQSQNPLSSFSGCLSGIPLC